jgi:octaprenyl-diphosphate synthase
MTMTVQPQQAPSAPNALVQVASYLATELKAIDGVLHGVVDSESPLIREVSDYVCLGHGKKLRPILCLLATRAFHPKSQANLEMAAAMELIHVATLLHDDVIDKASMRRGKPTVNVRWGDDVAILMADYLYSAAFDLLIRRQGSQRPLHLIATVTRRMCEGEMFQIEHRGQLLSLDDYLRMCACKTGWLFSACVAIGGELAGLPEAQVSRLAAFGMDFGLAFQITDDVLDYAAQDAHWGKAVGGDLEAGKQTLPLILTLRDAAPDERARLESIIRHGGDLAPVREAIKRGRAIERSLDEARQYAQRAMSNLDGLSPADPVAFDHLASLPEYVIDRRY